MSHKTKHSETINHSEHIAPEITGDNIAAKKVANYFWDGTDWQRQGILFTAGKDFDYLGIANTNTNEDTLTYKTGGSGGTTVRTLVITYASGADKVSDDLASLAFS